MKYLMIQNEKSFAFSSILSPQPPAGTSFSPLPAADYFLLH
jgi:hypothetical protein